MTDASGESKNRRILVIDDNPAIHDDFRSILARTCQPNEFDALKSVLFGDASDEPIDTVQFDVESALQGKEGLEKVVQARRDGLPFALAFVDMRMPPGWDGMVTIEHLWQEDPDLQVVICTAYSDYSWHDMVQRFGQSDRLLVLKKPFDIVEVCQLALALTEKWNLAQQAREHTEHLEELVLRRTAEVRQRDELLHRKRRLEAVGSLAGGVAHEFNNLLQVVRGYVQFAIDDLPSQSPTRRDLQEALAAVEQAANVTGKLLNFSRQQHISRRNVDLNKVLSQIPATLLPLLGNVDLRIEPNREEVPVRIDRSLIEEVLMSLCINAKDAMPAGGTLTLSTEIVKGDQLPEPCADSAEEYACLHVSDTGSGMSDEVRQRAFEPFFTTKDVGCGSGLGLAMAHGVIQEHGGQIDLKSRPGHGTTVSIYLPLETESGSEGPAECAPGGEDRAQVLLPGEVIQQWGDVPAMERTP